MILKKIIFRKRISGTGFSGAGTGTLFFVKVTRILETGREIEI